ncbi:hypothetical protein TSAR_009326 [Trichomalopsis sarcophagae]|uniref:Uncharacterized protein n=1 Tax=Trichomalopsis sarcophagae TaxID=543379 RepID=A0A232F4U9_9HYME|nr:hypothetical protein TSAR_009326 [Trichomalopsis sarcophagae]
MNFNCEFYNNYCLKKIILITYYKQNLFLRQKLLIATRNEQIFCYPLRTVKTPQLYNVFKFATLNFAYRGKITTFYNKGYMMLCNSKKVGQISESLPRVRISGLLLISYLS